MILTIGEEVDLVRQSLVKTAKSYLGVRQGDAKYKELIRKYNAVKPLPVGYKLKENDDWCAAFVTVMADLSNCSKYIGRECGVHRFTQLFKSKGIWLGKVKPMSGDIIVFDWRKDSWMDHIGIVEEFSANKVTVIEGNTSRCVARRTYNWNDWKVAGYARPKYPLKSIKKEKSKHDLASEVIAGKWGNGKERAEKLRKAGHDVQLIQKEVNRQLKTKNRPLRSNKLIAKEVIQGKWGNGSKRKKALKKAGYNHKSIQKIVNQLI